MKVKVNERVKGSEISDLKKNDFPKEKKNENSKFQFTVKKSRNSKTPVTKNQLYKSDTTYPLSLSL